MTSVCSVTFARLNLTRVFRRDNTLLQCLEVLVSEQHGRKVQKVTLDGVSIETIFDAETFCKKFVNRLLKVEELVVSKC